MPKESTATVTLSIEEYLDLREKATLAEDPDRIVIVEHPLIRHAAYFTALPPKFTYRGKDDLLKTMSEANHVVNDLTRRVLDVVQTLPKRYRRRFDR